MKTIEAFAFIALAAALTLVAAGYAQAGGPEVEVDSGIGLTFGSGGLNIDSSGSVPMGLIQQGLEGQAEQEPRPLAEMLQQPASEDALPQGQEDMALEIERERAKRRLLEEEIERLRGEPEQ